MQYGQLTSLLERWARFIISESKNNLLRSGKKDGKLYKSFNYKVDKDDNGFKLEIYAEDYAKFIDLGVKGADPNIITEWTKNRGKPGSKSVRSKPIQGIQKAPNSPFSYSSKYPPATNISSWAKKNNFRLRDDKGRFVRGGYKAIGFVLSKFIFAQGIRPTMFLTNAVNTSMARYAGALAVEIAQDFENRNKDK